jgi:hypothetical protein
MLSHYTTSNEIPAEKKNNAETTTVAGWKEKVFSFFFLEGTLMQYENMLG